MIWPGDSETGRCPAPLVYNYDLLTGGGQYVQIDWRLFPAKFPHAKGVTALESLYTRTYNLAQYYFGLYESTPWLFADPARPFATTTPLTYASIYHNRVWGDLLIPVANMASTPQKTSLSIMAAETLGILPQQHYLLFDVQQRVAMSLRGDAVNQGLTNLSIPAQDLRLFCLRAAPPSAPFHLWGGKRISERWDAATRKLTLAVQGPAGLHETLILGGANHGLRQVLFNGHPAAFYFDPAQRLAHGRVVFTPKPLTLEFVCSPDDVNHLPHKPLPPSLLK
jgi:hypothetical protein